MAARSTTATSSNAGGADSELLPIPPSLEIGTAGGGSGGNGEKFAMEDWESVLSESVAVSPSQEQSILRWIMGDVEDPAMGSLNKVLQIGGGAGGVSAAAEFEFSGGFGVGDQGFGGDQYGATFMPTVPSFPNNNRSSAEKIGLAPNPISSNLSTNFKNEASHFQFTAANKPAASSAGSEPVVFFFPLSYAQQQEQNLFMPPQAKRHNPGGPVSGGLEPGSQISKGSFADTAEQELFMGRQQLHLQQQPLPHQLHLLPHYMQQRPMGPGQKPKIGGGDELGHCHQQQQQQQQAIVDQLYKAAELVQTGNPVLAQGILARLNHQLSQLVSLSIICCKLLAIASPTNNNNVNPSTASSSPFSLIFKIGAYKSFSEISPLIQFANFTCNQALLEVLEGFDRIHIVDFDIGFGGQWASLMQELALRSGGAPSLKITALASPSTHDQLELGLTRENLIQFASEINIPFEFEAMSIDSLNSGSWSLPFHASENEAVAVNLPIGSLANCQLSVPLVLRFVKQLSPRIVVSVDRGCDRTDLPFANHIIHAFIHILTCLSRLMLLM
ncbi:UNVERIFIED_CONTAM: Scarecrow-like protein 6 [Sesamum radiatum]|uniref:Scarecrow-like protein 6 n=1 Tax=Sesamum radiatum TaxID=300843 RepID=A0AAW2V9R7_SESRA